MKWLFAISNDTMNLTLQSICLNLPQQWICYLKWHCGENHALSVISCSKFTNKTLHIWAHMKWLFAISNDTMNLTLQSICCMKWLIMRDSHYSVISNSKFTVEAYLSEKIKHDSTVISCHKVTVETRFFPQKVWLSRPFSESNPVGVLYGCVRWCTDIQRWWVAYMWPA